MFHFGSEVTKEKIIIVWNLMIKVFENRARFDVVASFFTEPNHMEFWSAMSSTLELFALDAQQFFSIDIAAPSEGFQ